MTSLSNLLLLLLSTAFLTHLLMPAVRRLGVAWGLVDHPSWRRNQTQAVPCSGGLAIYAATLLAAIPLSLWVGLPFQGPSLWALGLAGLGTIVLGVLDDRFGLHAEKKLLGQMVVCSLPMASGLVLRQLSFPGLGTVELGLLSGPVTLFWYLGFINSINLIDGLDGLASGIVSLVLGAMLLSVAPADPVGVVWILALLGSVLGFLRGNLSERRIFLGDAGSMLLGLWLAGLALGLSRSTPSTTGMAVAAMTIPILDTSTTIVRRWRRGVSVFRPDCEHLHHRLLRLGTTPRRAVACLWFLTVAAASLGAMFHGLPSAGILALGAAAAAAIEMAYTLPREGHPSVGDALRYLVGVRSSLDSQPRQPQLAEVIEMQPYQRLRRGGRDRVAYSQPVKEEASAVEAVPTTPKATAAQIGAAGKAQDDVVLAATEEPR
jgi:UDP-GlcNAc:undecaprenyl-phosphate GlcNAc-1-phosphate transferase